MNLLGQPLKIKPHSILQQLVAKLPQDKYIKPMQFTDFPIMFSHYPNGNYSSILTFRGKQYRINKNDGVTEFVVDHYAIPESSRDQFGHWRSVHRETISKATRPMTKPELQFLIRYLQQWFKSECSKIKAPTAFEDRDGSHQQAGMEAKTSLQSVYQSWQAAFSRNEKAAVKALHKADAASSRKTPAEGCLGYSGSDEYCYMLDRDSKMHFVFDGGDFNGIGFVVRDFSKDPRGPQRKMTAEELAEITKVAMTQRPSGRAVKAAYTVFDERKKQWLKLYEQGGTYIGPDPKVGDRIEHEGYIIQIAARSDPKLPGTQEKQIILK